MVDTKLQSDPANLAEAISTGGAQTNNATAMMIDVNQGSNVEKLLTVIGSFGQQQAEYLKIISSRQPGSVPTTQPLPVSNPEPSVDNNQQGQGSRIASLFGVGGTVAKGALVSMLGDYARYVLPLMEAFNGEKEGRGMPTRDNSSPITDSAPQQPIQQSSDGVLMVDYAESSVLGNTLASIKNSAEQQVQYLSQLVDYNLDLKNALIAQSVSEVPLSQRTPLLGTAIGGGAGVAATGVLGAGAGGGSLLTDLLTGVFQGLGIQVAATSLRGLLSSALPRIIPAILGPIVGILTGPVGLAALTGAVIVGGAFLLSEYLKEKRDQFIIDIDKEVADGIKEIRDEKDVGSFRSLGLRFGLVSPESTTEDLVGLEQTVQSFRMTPRAAGRGPLPQSVIENAQKIDWKKAEAGLSPEAYQKLRGQFEAIHKDIQTPGFLFNLSTDKLNLLRRLSVLAGQSGDVKLIDDFMSKSAAAKLDPRRSMAIQNDLLMYGVDRDRQRFIAGDRSIMQTIGTALTALESPLAAAQPQIIVAPINGPAGAPTSVVTNSNNTNTTIIQKTQDPSGSLMLQSQMLGGGYGDVPIFNWGY